MKLVLAHRGAPTGCLKANVESISRIRSPELFLS
jgi:hypothetical protein